MNSRIMRNLVFMFYLAAIVGVTASEPVPVQELLRERYVIME